MRFILRYARQSPVFSVIALLTVAFGSGATLALLALLDALVLRPLPVSSPDRLVAVYGINDRNQQTALPLGVLPRLAETTPMVADVAGYSGSGLTTVDAGGGPITATFDLVTGNYFDVLRVQPHLGRLIQPADAGPAPEPVVVVGHRFWRNHLKADPSTIGTTLRVEGIPLTIVGVTPETFEGLRPGTPADVTVPITLIPRIAGLKWAPDQIPVAFAIGRLRDGATLEALRNDLQGRWQALLVSAPAMSTADRAQIQRQRPRLISAETGFSYLRDRFARPLTMLLLLAGALLLIACVNLAGLLLVHSASREHEQGVRLALGASPGQLVRGVLGESLGLAAAGTLIGVPFAFWCVIVLARTIGATMAVPFAVGAPRFMYALVAIGATALTIGAIAGIGPAWVASRRRSETALQPSRTVSLGTRRWARVVLVVEMALSLVLMTGAAILSVTAANLRRVDLGFETDGVMLVGLMPQPGSRDSFVAGAYFSDIVVKLKALPGIEAVSLNDLPSAVGRLEIHTVPVSAGPGSPREDPRAASLVRVTPDFTASLGVTLLTGRDITWADDERVPPVAVISESLAKQLFAARDAVGQMIQVESGSPTRVVGVVRDPRLIDVRAPSSLLVIVPLLQAPARYQRASVAFVRARGDQPIPLDAVRGTFASAGRDYIRHAGPLGEMVRQASLREELSASIGTFFGGFAAALSGLGIYSVLAFHIGRRRREIAVRVAVGASPASIWRMVIGESLALAAAGTAVGVPLALGTTRLLAAQLYGVSPFDVRVHLLATALLIVIAFAAGLAPARSAASINPIDALRAD